MPGLWEWIPGEAVGPFRFGEPAGELIEHYNLVKQEPIPSIPEWDVYEMPGWDSSMTVEDGNVWGVDCRDSCLLDGNELLGMSFAVAQELLGPEDALEEGIGFGQAAYYGRLGLTLWLNEDDVIDSTTCESLIDDDQFDLPID